MSHASPTPPRHPLAARWARWLVRLVLVAAVIWDAIVVRMLLGNTVTRDEYVGPVPATAEATWHWGQLAWAVAATIAGVGLLWALLSSARGRLGRRSWMPIVGLLLVIGMASVAALNFVIPSIA